MTPRRQLTRAVLGCAAGAGVTLWAASMGWQVTVVHRVAPLAPQRVSRVGAALYPSLPAVALVALAGAGALLATRGPLRRLLGGLLAACGGVTAAIAGRAIATGLPPGWPLLCCAGGLLVAGAGVAAASRGHRWPAMGARYDRPASRAADGAASRAGDGAASRAGDGAAGAAAGSGTAGDGAAQIWDALDRGEDRTRDWG